MVLQPVRVPSTMKSGSGGLSTERVMFGAAMVMSAAGPPATCKMAMDEGYIIGLAADLQKVMPGREYGFYGSGDLIQLLLDEGLAMVVPNGADIDIERGDFLEVAALGDSSTTHGLLEEAGAAAGKTRTVAAVAQALESVDMGSKSYKVPASDVAIGDEHIHMTGTDIATMGIKVGDYILMENLNGDTMINRIKALTASVITLQLASLITLVNGDSDLVTRIYQCPVRLI